MKEKLWYVWIACIAIVIMIVLRALFEYGYLNHTILTLSVVSIFFIGYYYLFKKDKHHKR